MVIRYDLTLSTTEPNNDVGLIKIRQADEQTQTLVVQITENGVPKSYEGLQAFFCAKLGQSLGIGIIEQKLNPEEMTNPKTGLLEYTMRAEDWQQLGRQTGYFSFRRMKDDHEFVEQFTTRDFYFNVIKNVFSDGITEVKKDGSTYVWTIEDLIRLFNEYITSGKTDWEEFIEQNKEILESVDPGGTILSELIRARKPASINTPFKDLPERLDAMDQNNRKDLKTYPTINEMIADVLLNPGEFVRCKGWKTVDDGGDIVYKLVAITDPEFKDNVRNAKMSVVIRDVMVAIPTFDRYVPEKINDDLIVNEVIDCAKSYYENKDKLKYDVHRAHCVFDSSMNMFDTEGKAGIVCSDLVNLSLIGTKFEDSRYSKPSMTVNKKSYEWGLDWLFNHRKDNRDYDAHSLARLAYQSGNLLTVNTDWSNIRRGDVLFFSQSVAERGNGQADTQFLNIFHNAIYNGWGQIIQSSDTIHGAVTIDNIQSEEWRWLRESVVGFTRFSLQNLNFRYRRQSDITPEMGIDAYTPKLSIFSGIVSITFEGTRLKTNQTGKIVVGTIQQSKYLPQTNRYFLLTTSYGRVYRGQVETDGIVSIFANSTVESADQLYGYVDYPLKNVDPSYPNY
ncbi:phage baseplate upper protein [Enterococcus dispar]|uniref:phage baseplate upper protein n=1 Tax=Enterococcus dispar TaxID=44009 RepID=UPI00232DBC76|nr:phage baseplate upper protein [Enterococcus dispar]WCG33967.1 phage baseplate upper protein [Enterococcus dispar]